MIHALKTLPKYFEEVRLGTKRFELRENDRDFRVGDYLALNEWDRATQTYTGRTELVSITYMMNPNDVMTCPAGFAVMSISRESECDSVREEAAQCTTI